MLCCPANYLYTKRIMPHIHTEPGQHDHTVGIYIFRTDFAEPKVMLHFHKKIKKYAQFGGHVELQESPWQAVLHELHEETGYDMSQLKILQPSQRLQQLEGATVHPQSVAHVTMGYPSFGGHHHTDSTYVFITNEPPRQSPEAGESTDIKLFTRKEVAEGSQTDSITHGLALYAFDEILPNWQPVSPNNFS
jgi:8-oxo-dGTP pyrophosphatase MutT (NUDIX family)